MSNKEMAKRSYFPNNWQQYKDSEDDFFHPHTFEEIMEWKVANWQLPSSIACIIRVCDTKTKKTQEYVYKSRGSAEKMVSKLLRTENIEFYVCNHEAIHHVFD